MASVAKPVTAAAIMLATVACGAGESKQLTASDSSASSSRAVVQVLTEAIDRVSAASPTKARSGEGVSVGQTLRTDGAGLGQLDYPDGSLTRVGPSTTFTLTALTATSAQRVVLGAQGIGSTWHRVKATTSGGSRYEITTPVGVAAVRGTSFAITCPTKTKCTVTVAEGTVSFSSSGGTETTLPAGQRATFAASGPTAPPAAAGPDQWVTDNQARDAGRTPSPPTTSGAALPNACEFMQPDRVPFMTKPFTTQGWNEDGTSVCEASGPYNLEGPNTGNERLDLTLVSLGYGGASVGSMEFTAKTREDICRRDGFTRIERVQLGDFGLLCTRPNSIHVYVRRGFLSMELRNDGNNTGVNAAGDADAVVAYVRGVLEKV